MRDFTLQIYVELLKAIKKAGYNCLSYENFVQQGQTGRSYILRHDVDDLPENSLATARLEAEAGMQGTYYFRIVKQSFSPDIIRAIADLGHEIGYHYEDLSLCHGDYDKAYKQFLLNLEAIRAYYPVKTICMHGSPLSRWDNRLLWDKFDYKKSGILAEPYFDTDFSKVYYLTDTSRMWNGSGYSVRDKVRSSFNISVTSTEDLIRKIRNDALPSRVMQNIHPQRWTDDILPWTKELLFQNAKNVVKSIVRRFNK
ncbi:MAG TPA: hypothetical protein PKJ62_03220 [Bacteroidia bacterium]|nr:hypothetical protein [Bacteroidia bacterium]HNS12528.1 hypothetical protein [Bacteroidia bacterium]